jgi:branched-chain amino acid transport system ATP-binding protein
LGLVHVPQGRQIIPTLSVEENLVIGASHLPGITKDAIERRLEQEYARFPVLKTRRSLAGGSLSGGEQQMLAMARILRAGARLLLLDEISEGLAPVIVKRLSEVILQLRQKEFTIVMAEQNFHFAASLADRMYVVEQGRVVVEIAKDEVEGSRQLLRELLGV